jgi:hypothetical protein
MIPLTTISWYFRLDNYLSLLETKLSSVPGIETDGREEIKQEPEATTLSQDEVTIELRSTLTELATLYIKHLKLLTPLSGSNL